MDTEYYYAKELRKMLLIANRDERLRGSNCWLKIYINLNYFKIIWLLLVKIIQFSVNIVEAYEIKRKKELIS